MSEQRTSVSVDDLRAASEQQAAAWEQAVRRAEGGEAVAVLAHGRHVADIVPSGESERLREMIEVLSDNDLLPDLHAGLDDLRAGRLVSADDVAEDLRRRSAQQ
jgi:antitoxin (DNA-binding transcriptional repressor) of toxin-antitoxin stability system